jgi:hypothetical protein
MTATFFATRHAIYRFRKRTRAPQHVSCKQSLETIVGILSGREDEVRQSIRSNRPFSIAGEIYYFDMLTSLEGEVFLLKSYWIGDVRGLSKVKMAIKRYLMRILNDW